MSIWTIAKKTYFSCGAPVPSGSETRNVLFAFIDEINDSLYSILFHGHRAFCVATFLYVAFSGHTCLYLYGHRKRWP